MFSHLLLEFPDNYQLPLVTTTTTTTTTCTACTHGCTLVAERIL